MLYSCHIINSFSILITSSCCFIDSQITKTYWLHRPILQSLELLKKKREEISSGIRGHAPPSPYPGKFLKVETKMCAIWGILEANLKKSSTLKFIMNITFLPSICIHRSMILIFIEKKCMLVDFFAMENILFHNFRYSFLRESSFPRRIPGSDTGTGHKNSNL